MKRPIGVVLSIVALVVAGACNGSDSPTVNAPTTPAAAAIVLPTLGPAADYHPVFHPADFSANIDNPWFPLKPGSTFIYTGTKDGKSAREVFAPSSQTKIIAGVPCRVLVDKLYLNGKLAEDTRDYYSQDKAGNVWYFGEDTRSIEEGAKVDTSGSWAAGVGGGQPGVFMEADPRVGHAYRQEYYKGEAEDQYKVVSLSDHIAVPYGSYDAALRTEETTALEPQILDNKYYVRGIGEVMEVQVKGPPPIEKLELKEIR